MNTPPIRSRAPRFFSSTGFFLRRLAVACGLFSTAIAAEAPKAVVLSPFSVNDDRDEGYAASSSLAGSRLNTPLKDTAASITVMTSQFLADIGATSLTEVLEWGNNVQQLMSDDGAFGAAPAINPNGFFTPADNFTVRGIKATITRNYFTWPLPTDSYNIERIEEARGPNSVLFGIGSTGGIINVSTKQAQVGRSFRRAAATFGSSGSYRGTLDWNQTAYNQRLAVRLNALYDRTGSWRTYGFRNQEPLHLAITSQLASGTRLRGEYERGKIDENIASPNAVEDASTSWLASGRPAFAVPIAVPATNPLNLARYGVTRITYVENNAALFNMGNQNYGNTYRRPIIDRKIADRGINTGGPGQLRDSSYDAISLYLEHKIGRSTYIEAAYNHQQTDSVSYQPIPGSTAALSFDPNETLAPVSGSTVRAVNPFVRRLMFDGPWKRNLSSGRSDDTRVTVSTEFDFGKWGNYRLAALGEYEARVSRGGPQWEVWEGRPFNANPENSANQVFRRNYVTEGNWGTYYINGPRDTGLIQGMRDPVTGRTFSSTWIAQNANQNDNPNYQTTLLLGGQARYFGDRLVVGAGYRNDSLDVTQRGAVRDPSTNGWITDYRTKVDSSYSGITRTLGIVGHVTRNVSLLYNQSSNFDLPNINLRLLPDGRPPTNPRGKGKDMGIALNLFDGKLNARAVYYESTSFGQHNNHGLGNTSGADGNNPSWLTGMALDSLVNAGLITEVEAARRRVDANGITFDRKSEGYEFNLTANPTRNWRLQANYSYTNSVESNLGPELKAWAAEILPYLKRFPGGGTTAAFGTVAGVIARTEEVMATQFALDGANVGGSRRDKVSFFSRYSLSTGPFKGGFFGGGYRHHSKNVAWRTPQGEFLYGPSYGLADVLVGYRLGRVPVFKAVTIQVNVFNLLDDHEPLITSYFDDRSIRRWVTREGRSWRASANLTF